jgi:hypothetical protein
MNERQLVFHSSFRTHHSSFLFTDECRGGSESMKSMLFHVSAPTAAAEKTTSRA